MEEDDYSNEADAQNITRVMESLKSTNWMVTANENTIDSLFNYSMKLQDNFGREEKEKFNESLAKKYPGIKLKKLVDLLLAHLLRSQHLNESLTLYAIEKYIFLFSKNDFRMLLEKVLAKAKLCEHLYELGEDLSEVDLDWFKINSLLEEISESGKTDHKMLNSLKNQMSLFLKNINHSSLLEGQCQISKIISVLELQEDLKLWFILLKEENLNTILDLCAKYDIFMSAIFNFFDKFANEVESNYDEELHVKYSSVNLDFEDFIQIFQAFLGCEAIKKLVDEYLDRKIQLEDNNVLFWIDVKACVYFPLF